MIFRGWSALLCARIGALKRRKNTVGAVCLCSDEHKLLVNKYDGLIWVNLSQFSLINFKVKLVPYIIRPQKVKFDQTN